MRQWAKDEYKLESVEKVIASVALEGGKQKIGSIYFEGDGRIRTTHGASPERSKHGDRTTLQFNIESDRAEAAFKAAHRKNNPPLNTLSRTDRNELWRACEQLTSDPGDTT